MSLPYLSCEPRMYPPRKPSRPGPPFQDRRSECFASSVPEAAAGFETPDWCQLEQYPPYSADFDTIDVELPQPTSCESLDSSCPRGESSESPVGTPRSKEPPREASESSGSLSGFGFAEVVETSGFWGGDAMEPSNPEDDPTADPSQDDIAAYSRLLQGLQADSILATAGALLNAPAEPPPDAPAGTFPTTAGTPGIQPLTAGERFPPAGGSLSLSDIPAVPRWRVNPFWLTTMHELERAPGPSTSQAPVPPHPHASPVSLPPLGREIPDPELANLPTQQQGGASQGTPDLNSILTDIFTSNLGANPSANLGVSQPVTFDLRENLGGDPSSGASFDGGFGRSMDSLLEFARRGISPGGSLPAPPRLASIPTAPLRLPSTIPPEDVATLRFPSQREPYLNVTFPEPAQTSLPSRPLDPLDPWRREGTLPDSQPTLTELLARVSALSGGLAPERLAQDPPGRTPKPPSGGLQRVASAPPLGGATRATLVAPTEPPLESPGVLSAVQLAASEGSPAATSAPAKQPRKRNLRGRGAKKQLEKAPSLKRPPSPMADPVRNPDDNPPQNPPQDPGGDQGAAADPTSMEPKRTFSLRSTPSVEEPGAEGGGQDAWRALKKARDASPGRGAVSTHSSGGASAAGSRSLNAPPMESEGPKEGGEEKTQKRRLERKRKLHELRAKPCGCTQDWPNDVQKLRGVCNEQSLELRSIKMQQNLMNRRDSEQTQEIEELRQAVEDLTRALDAARAQLARQGAVFLPGGSGAEPRPVEGARAPAEARAGVRARESRPRDQAERGGSGSEEESSRGTGSM